MPPVKPDTLYAFTEILEKSYDDDGVLHVKGLATDATLDMDQQRCDPEWLKTAMPGWYEWGNICEMHGQNAVGTAVDMEQKGAGWVIEAAIIDPLAARKVEKGVLRGFSIGIKDYGLDKSAQALELAPKGIINKGDICEISLVDRPSNPNAKLQIAKMVDGELVKSDLDVAMEVETQDECPPCDRCDGIGEVPDPDAEGDNKFVTCPKCGGDGTGSINVLPSLDGGDQEEGAVGEKAADADKVNCPTCKGDGKIMDGNRDCPDCGATGKVTPEKAESMKSVVTDEFGWSAADKAEWTPWQKSIMPDSFKKDYSAKERAQLAESGAAMPGGGFPIKTVQDLKNAIQAFGRAKDPAKAKAHIKARAKALGRTDLIPDNWKSADALASALGATLTKAADGDTYQHDPALLAAIRDGLIECATAELEEMKDGEDETWDVSVLVGCLSQFLAWQSHESAEGETTSPFGDDMSMTALGVSPDLVKAASAESATDEDKTALRDALKSALGVQDTDSIKTSLSEALEKAASLEERLVKVEAMAAPRTISLRAQQQQQSRATEAELLEAEAHRLQTKALTWADPETKKAYNDEANKLLAKVADLRSTL